MHPTNTRTIFETADHCSSARQTSHVEGAHNDAQLLGSCECYCRAGIGFFELSKDFILREFFQCLPLPPLRNPTLVCAKSTQWAVLPAQDVTLLDCTAPSDWVTHSELPKVATILFRLCRTARHPFSSELSSTWLKPINRRTNVCSSMHIRRRSIPKEREEAPTGGLFA